MEAGRGALRLALFEFRPVLDAVGDENLLQDFVLRLLSLNSDIGVGDLGGVRLSKPRYFSLQRPHVLFFSLAMGSVVVSTAHQLCLILAATSEPDDSVPVAGSGPACCRVWDLGVSEAGHLQVCQSCSGRSVLSLGPLPRVIFFGPLNILKNSVPNAPFDVGEACSAMERMGLPEDGNAQRGEVSHDYEVCANIATDGMRDHQLMAP